MSYSSLPCFLHELDPTHLGYLRRDEVLDLLRDLLATDLPGTRVEQAWVHAMLLRHLGRIEDRRPTGLMPVSQLMSTESGGTFSATSDYDRERLEARIQDALPRLEDTALRQDLGQIAFMLSRNSQDGGLRQHG